MLCWDACVLLRDTCFSFSPFMFLAWIHPTLQTDEDSVTHPETLWASFTEKIPHFKMRLTGTFVRVVTIPVNYCDIQLLLQCLPITRAPSKGTAGPATPPLIGWIAVVKRAGMRWWAHVTGIMTMLRHGSLFLIVCTSAFTEQICNCLRPCVCFCTCCTLNTIILLLLLAKWEGFGKRRLFKLQRTVWELRHCFKAEVGIVLWLGVSWDG